VKQPYPKEWDTKAPRLSVIAAWINEHTTMLAEIGQGFCSTDRKLAGTRLIHKGKGRTGNRLKVFECEAHKLELFRKPYNPYRDDHADREYQTQPLLDHNAAETYRQNSDVIRWLQQFLSDHPGMLGDDMGGEPTPGQKVHLFAQVLGGAFRTTCGIYVNGGQITAHPKEVTCGKCKKAKP
jgi:hypothetical protein